MFLQSELSDVHIIFLLQHKKEEKVQRMRDLKTIWIIQVRASPTVKPRPEAHIVAGGDKTSYLKNFKCSGEPKNMAALTL